MGTDTLCHLSSCHEAAISENFQGRTGKIRQIQENLEVSEMR